MNPANIRHAAIATRSAVALSGVLLALGLWLTAAALTANAATSGTVVAWGWNDYGLTNEPVAAQSGVTAIAAGRLHTVTLKSDGSVVAWGVNYSGQVTGTPTLASPNTAITNSVTLGGQVLRNVTAIATGSDHTVALLGTAQPYLIPTVTETNLTLSWQSAIAQGFALHGNASVGLTNSWAVVGQSAVSNLGYYSVTLPLTNASQFFQLKKP